MAKTRRDSHGVVLRRGESYRKQDKRYVYSYTDKYGKRRAVYNSDLVALRAIEDEIKMDLHDGINLYEAEQMTVNDLFDRYLAVKVNLRRTTKQNYMAMYNRHVRYGFGKNRIKSLKYSDVKKFYIKLVEEDGIKPRTVGTINCCLHPAFNMAVKEDLIRKNPVEGVYSEILEHPENVVNERRALTRAQQKAFLDYMDDHPIFDHWWPVFQIFLGTGMRCGELIGLRWEDIDMDAKTISVNHSLVRVKKSKNDPAKRVGVSQTKTKAGNRMIPMLDRVQEAFERIYEEQLITGFNETVIEGMDGFIFKNAEGDVLCDQNINAAIKRITEMYNVEEELKAAKERREPELLPHFSCHNLRHTFATRLCENETNLKVIQSVMGHANIRTTMNIYAEANEDVVKESFEALSEKWKDL